MVNNGNYPPRSGNSNTLASAWSAVLDEDQGDITLRPNKAAKRTQTQGEQNPRMSQYRTRGNDTDSVNGTENINPQNVSTLSPSDQQSQPKDISNTSPEPKKANGADLSSTTPPSGSPNDNHPDTQPTYYTKANTQMLNNLSQANRARLARWQQTIAENRNGYEKIYQDKIKRHESLMEDKLRRQQEYIEQEEKMDKDRVDRYLAQLEEEKSRISPESKKHLEALKSKFIERGNLFVQPHRQAAWKKHVEDVIEQFPTEAEDRLRAVLDTMENLGDNYYNPENPFTIASSQTITKVANNFRRFYMKDPYGAEIFYPDTPTKIHKLDKDGKRLYDKYGNPITEDAYSAFHTRLDPADHRVLRDILTFSPNGIRFFQSIYHPDIWDEDDYRLVNQVRGQNLITPLQDSEDRLQALNDFLNTNEPDGDIIKATYSALEHLESKASDQTILSHIHKMISGTSPGDNLFIAPPTEEEKAVIDALVKLHPRGPNLKQAFEDHYRCIETMSSEQYTEALKDGTLKPLLLDQGKRLLAEFGGQYYVDEKSDELNDFVDDCINNENNESVTRITMRVLQLLNTSRSDEDLLLYIEDALTYLHKKSSTDATTESTIYEEKKAIVGCLSDLHPRGTMLCREFYGDNISDDMDAALTESEQIYEEIIPGIYQKIKNRLSKAAPTKSQNKPKTQDAPSPNGTSKNSSQETEATISKEDLEAKKEEQRQRMLKDNELNIELYKSQIEPCRQELAKAKQLLSDFNLAHRSHKEAMRLIQQAKVNIAELEARKTGLSAYISSNNLSEDAPVHTQLDATEHALNDAKHALYYLETANLRHTSGLQGDTIARKAINNDRAIDSGDPKEIEYEEYISGAQIEQSRYQLIKDHLEEGVRRAEQALKTAQANYQGEQSFHDRITSGRY